jgi:hypothetical protein
MCNRHVSWVDLGMKIMATETRIIASGWRQQQSSIVAGAYRPQEVEKKSLTLRSGRLLVHDCSNKFLIHGKHG